MDTILVLRRELDRLRQENDQLRQELLRNRKQELVEHLLRGEFRTADKITADLHQVGVHLTKESFVELYVHVLMAVPSDPQRTNNQAIDPRAFRDKFEDGLWEIIRQVYPEYFCGAIRIGDGVAAILQMDQHTEGIPQNGLFVEDLNRRGLVLADRLLQENGLETFVAISRPHQGVEQIPEAHREILEIDSYRSLMGIDVPLLCYHDFEVAETEQRTNFEILSLEHRYLADVELGDYENARKTLQTLIDEEFRRAVPSLYTLRSKLSSKMDLLLITLEKYRGKGEASVYGEVDRLRQELEQGSYTVRELRAQIDRIFSAIAEFESRRQAPRWMGMVLRYIEENYTCAEFNVASISEAFRLNPSYLTREVKRYTGSGLLDLLQKKRLDYAVALMGAGVGTAQAAERSGFGDVRALRRAMKKYQGTGQKT